MKVIVTEHREEWHQLFEEEARKLTGIFGEELIDLHHIGSTSVSGLHAKPIIDMMPVVRDIGQVDRFNFELKQMGYEALGEFGIPGRRYFRKGGAERTHQMHVFQEDNRKDINRHLAVRDYLRTHRDEANAYGALKKALAKEFPRSIEAYVAGKNDFVKALEKRALCWHEKGRL